MVKKHRREPRSQCPIASALELIGDRWTMLILRDLFVGKKRYSEFRASPEEISTNILADRLSMMEESGLVVAKPYQNRPLRFEYELTDKGLGLLPALQELCRWGNKHIPDTCVPPASFMEQKVG